MLRYQRSAIICSRVAKRCGLQRSQHWSLLCASRKSCSQQGALALLPEGTRYVSLSLQGMRGAGLPQEHHMWWQRQSCRGHEKMQQGGKGLFRKGGWMSPGIPSCHAPASTAFVSAILTHLQLQGGRAREMCPGMQNDVGAQGISQAGGNRRFLLCVITQECHSSLCEGRFLILHQSV